MSRFFKNMFLATVVALAVVSCGSPKDISLQSYTVEDVSIKGMRSLGFDLALEIDNPSVKITASEIQGVVRQGPRDLITFEAEDITLSAKSTKTYVIPCVATLADGVSVMDIVSAAADRRTSDLKADISFVGKAAGIQKKVEFNDLSVAALIKKLQ